VKLILSKFKNMYKTRKSFFYFFSFLLLINCSGNVGETTEKNNSNSDIIVDKENIRVTKHFDFESKTYYYLTKIEHKDESGNLLKLRHAHANSDSGETVPNFAKRMDNPLVAINASMGRSNLPPDITKPSGIQIIDGVVIQDLPKSVKRNTLGIKDNNELVAYPPDITAQDILDDGVKNALSAFTTLIEDHESVPENVLTWVGNYSVKHPRQVIAQFDNRDLLIFSCGGRGYDGTGMTAKDVIRILKEQGVKFAFMLDGGGSVSTVVLGELITKKIDQHGTRDRARPNFLYIK